VATVAVPVWLYVDPVCPWCYQTARWVRRLEELEVVEIAWSFFSLEVQNAEEGVDILSHTRSVPAMRVAVLVREELGQAAVGRYYAAIGARMHERDEQLKQRTTIEGGLVDAGIDPAFADRALADEGTARRLQHEHTELSERGFGVPTLVLDRSDGPAMFGPVIPRVPDDAAAVELFGHVAWLIRNPNVYELKRHRVELPDLEGLRLAQIRRAARQAADAS
jgi:predicted DsbA family dithiol-disulfide isomerase